MRIVIGVDGSFESMYAVDVIAKRPWGDDTKAHVITAIRSGAPAITAPGLAPVVIPPEQLEAERRHAELLVSRAAEVLRGRGLSVATMIREGDPRNAILEEAKKWDADLIVVGSHGVSGADQLLIGSVAAHVAAHARCSVEIIRAKERSRSR